MRFLAVLKAFSTFLSLLSPLDLRELASLLRLKEPEALPEGLRRLEAMSSAPTPVRSFASAAIAELNYRAPSGWTPAHLAAAITEHLPELANPPPAPPEVESPPPSREALAAAERELRDREAPPTPESGSNAPAAPVRPTQA
ncbi:MAG TPA: hypothetical protein VJV75_03715 [Candidatus Polarisedimenticolia bacterium]|nr:hypothetical protein [Candidatus Polarisedimenticolia bacterium]